MENKENVTLDTFSILSNAGWLLIILKLSGLIATDWHNILGYWLVLLIISLVLGISTALIGLLVNKGGDK